MAWDPSRRVFLKGLGLAAVGVGFGPSPLMVRAAEAAQAGSKVLVKIFLRGGCDGLNMCVPYGDPEYYALRGGIAVPRAEVLNLDGYFGLHPALGALKPLFDDGRLAFVPAVGQYSPHAIALRRPGLHGDGHAGGQVHDHGLARSRASRGSPAPRSPRPSPLPASSRARTSAPSRCWSRRTSPASTCGRATGATRRSGCCAPCTSQRQTPVGRMGQETFAAMQTLLRTPEILAAPANGAVVPRGRGGNSLRQAAQLIKAGLGTRSIYVNVPGAFDTHSNQAFNNDARVHSASAIRWPRSPPTSGA